MEGNALFPYTVLTSVFLEAGIRERPCEQTNNKEPSPQKSKRYLLLDQIWMTGHSDLGYPKLHSNMAMIW